nr:polymorphic toxin-type HINT domain-containing protein [Actinopolymorpha pittospori]
MAGGKLKPISDIEVGDRVVATDPQTGEQQVEPVSAVWVHQDKLVDLRVAAGVVTTTEDHPFWNATDRAWQDAADIDPSDQLLTADGDGTSVGGIAWATQHTDTAYNLTIANIHTYYVLAGRTAVLVHNDGGFDWEKGLEDLKKGWDPGDLDDDGYHAPRGNQAENKEFKGAMREVERSLGRQITPAERRSLHDRITGQGYDFHRIVEEGKGMFGGC